MERSKKNKPNAKEAIEKLEAILDSKFPRIKVNDDLCFKKETGKLFKTFIFKNTGVIGIEYAANMDEAKLYRFEDGDLFWTEDYENLEDMFKDILEEINDA